MSVKGDYTFLVSISFKTTSDLYSIQSSIPHSALSITSHVCRQMSVLSERVRTVSEHVASTPPGSPDPSARKAASATATNVNKNAAAAGSGPTGEELKTAVTSQLTNGTQKGEGKKEEEKKLIEAEKMETERVSFFPICSITPVYLVIPLI